MDQKLMKFQGLQIFIIFKKLHSQLMLKTKTAFNQNSMLSTYLETAKN